MKRSVDALSIDLDPSPADQAAARGLNRSSIVLDLFRKHATRVRKGLSFRLRNEDDAQDATQEVFLKLWRQEREGNLRDDANAYLNSAAASMATDFERRRAFHITDRRAEVELEEVPSASPSLEERQSWRDAMALFVESVESLPEVARNVFLLHHMKGLTYPAIAKQLGISVRTAERQMAHAVVTLQRRLREYL